MSDVFRMKTSPEFGRYLVAKKEFQPGDKVFIDTPLIITPFRSNVKNPETFVCVGCCKVILKEKSVRCRDCLWHACNEVCVDEPWHKNFECKLFADKSIPPSLHTLRFLSLVRALLYAQSDALTFSKILNLSSHVQLMTKELKSNIDDRCKEVSEFLSAQCSIEVELPLIKKLNQIFLVNSFALASFEDVNSLYSGEALFANGCLFTHSCSPNLDWVLPSTNEIIGERWHLHLHARHEIKEGDILSIPYIQDAMTLGTTERRIEIAAHFFFNCKCKRCSDPSELGTNFSGITCKCCSDILLPKTPFESRTRWECLKCSNTLTSYAVEKLEERFDLTLAKVLKTEDDDDCCLKLDSLIMDCSCKYGLHENHCMVIRATVHWISRIDLDILLSSGSHIDFMYQLIKKRTKRCLNVCSRIGALWNWIMCEATMAMIIIKYHFKSKSGLSVDCDDYTLKDRITIFKRIIKHSRRGIILIKYSANDPAFDTILKKMTDGYEFWRAQLYKANRKANILDAYFQTEKRGIVF